METSSWASSGSVRIGWYQLTVGWRQLVPIGISCGCIGRPRQTQATPSIPRPVVSIWRPPDLKVLDTFCASFIQKSEVWGTFLGWNPSTLTQKWDKMRRPDFPKAAQKP